MFLLCRAVMLAQDDQPATQVLQLEKDNGDVVLRTLQLVHFLYELGIGFRQCFLVAVLLFQQQEIRGNIE